MTAGTKAARIRVSRRDWIEAAYRELARGGERAVAINALAARLGVTKGSFYWHFDDRPELMRALLDRWAHERTDEVLGLALGSTTEPRERLRRIIALAREVAPIDRAMRLWAQHDPAAEDAVRHADRALLGHIAGCLEDLGFDGEDARLRALLMLRSWAGGYLVPAALAGNGPDENDGSGPSERMLDILLGPTVTAPSGTSPGS